MPDRFYTFAATGMSLRQDVGATERLANSCHRVNPFLQFNVGFPWFLRCFLVRPKLNGLPV
jgi:hypothetical protein